MTNPRIKINNGYSNITIRNCQINSNKSPLLINGTNLTITNNTFNRKDNKAGTLNYIQANEIYGLTNINNNTVSDTNYRYGFDNFVWLETTNTKTGTLNINSNTITNIKKSILKIEKATIDSNKITVNVNNNTINTSMNIIPIYIEINNNSDLNNINLINFKNNSITSTNNERSRTFTGYIYLAKNIYNQFSNIYLLNPIAKFVFDNNSITNMTLNTVNYYGENAYNTKINGSLITTNYNVRNENYLIISEILAPSYHFDDLYSVINTRLVNG